MPPRATSPVWHLGSRQCQANGITIAIVDYAPNRVMPAHSHETLGISVVMRGLVEETAGSRTEVSGIASAVIKPPGTVHANRFGPEGARLLAMEMSPEQAEGLLGRHGFLDRWRWMRVMQTLGVTCRALSDLSQPLPMNGAAVENLAVELVAALDGDVLSSRGTPPSWLIRAHQRLDDDFATTFRVRELASEAGVHPVYLARRFRQHYGCSVLEYVHRSLARRHAGACRRRTSPLPDSHSGRLLRPEPSYPGAARHDGAHSTRVSAARPLGLSWWFHSFKTERVRRTKLCEYGVPPA